MDYNERHALDWLALHRSKIQYRVDGSRLYAYQRAPGAQEIRFDTYEQAANHFGWDGPPNQRLQKPAKKWLDGQRDVKCQNELLCGKDTGWVLVGRGAALEIRYPSYYVAAKELGWKGIDLDIRTPEEDEIPPPAATDPPCQEIVFDPYREVAARTRSELALHRSVIQYGIDSFGIWLGSRDPVDPVHCQDPLFAAHLRTLEARERVLDHQPSPADDEPPCAGCGQRCDERRTCFRSYEDWEMGGL